MKYFLIVLSLFCFPAYAENSPVQPLIGDEDYISDCGCYFYITKFEKPILYWPFREGEAVIKINGKLNKMEIVDDKIGRRKGQPTTFHLKNNNTKVKGNCITSSVCENDGECEVSKHKGQITLTFDNQYHTFTVKGSCGC